MEVCFEKCSATQCFMTLKLYNEEYENRDDGENSEKVTDNVIMHNHTSYRHTG